MNTITNKQEKNQVKLPRSTAGNTVFHKVEVLLTAEQIEHIRKMGQGSANSYIRELINDDIAVANGSY